jgi:hypothetical protein
LKKAPFSVREAVLFCVGSGLALSVMAAKFQTEAQSLPSRSDDGEGSFFAAPPCKNDGKCNVSTKLRE